MIHFIPDSMVTAVDLASAGVMVSVGVDMAGADLAMAGEATAGVEAMATAAMDGPAEAMATEVVMATEIGAALMV